MAFFDDLKRNASGAADKAVKKTNEFTNMAKLKMNVKSAEGKLSSVYEEIGRLFYTAERNGEDCTSDIAAYIMKADKLKAEIAESNKKISKLRNIRICEGCGNEIENDALFCPYCGQKQEIPEEAVEDIVENIEDAAEDVKEEAEEAVEDAVDAVEETAETIADSIADAAADLKDTVEEAIENLTDGE